MFLCLTNNNIKYNDMGKSNNNIYNNKISDNKLI
jgi:hypothetical protein